MTTMTLSAKRIRVIDCLKQDKIVALPTESVFGLSCRVKEICIQKLIRLKRRDATKGLILLGGSWEQLSHYVDQSILTSSHIEMIRTPQKKAITWVVPASDCAPKLLTGGRKTIAIRLTTDTFLKDICNIFGEAIISTSANIANAKPAKNSSQVGQYFPVGIDYIYEGEIMNNNPPSKILELLSGQVLRA
jgi:L-threonylcarbamoyladenylate synthase